MGKEFTLKLSETITDEGVRDFTAVLSGPLGGLSQQELADAKLDVPMLRIQGISALTLPIHSDAFEQSQSNRDGQGIHPNALQALRRNTNPREALLDFDIGHLTENVKDLSGTMARLGLLDPGDTLYLSTPNKHAHIRPAPHNDHTCLHICEVSGQPLYERYAPENQGEHLMSPPSLLETQLMLMETGSMDRADRILPHDDAQAENEALLKRISDSVALEQHRHRMTNDIASCTERAAAQGITVEDTGTTLSFSEYAEDDGDSPSRELVFSDQQRDHLLDRAQRFAEFTGHDTQDALTAIAFTYRDQMEPAESAAPSSGPSL